jgi:hypothetical protein
MPKPRSPVIIHACRECNGIKAGDDSYMRDAIAMDEACAGVPIVQKLLAGQIARSIAKNRSEVTKALRRRGMYLPERSDDGRDLGYRLSVPIHNRRFERWSEMIARGLYFAHMQERLPDEYEFDVVRIKDSGLQPLYDEFQATGATTYGMVHPDEGIEDIVGWSFQVDSKDRHHATWIVWFYNRYMLMISCQPPGLRPVKPS